jgi:hypothetical protein
VRVVSEFDGWHLVGLMIKQSFFFALEIANVGDGSLLNFRGWCVGS